MLYKLIVKDNNFIQKYTIKAKNLNEAVTKSKLKFKQEYNSISSNVTVSLNPENLKEHIIEILNYF